MHWRLAAVLIDAAHRALPRQAIVVCRAQRANPTLSAALEIVSLASPLVKLPEPGPGGPPQPLWLGLLRAAALLARSFAPAVVVAQGVRLVTTLVNKQRGGPIEKGNDTSTDGARTLCFRPCGSCAGGAGLPLRARQAHWPPGACGIVRYCLGTCPLPATSLTAMQLAARQPAALQQCPLTCTPCHTHRTLCLHRPTPPSRLAVRALQLGLRSVPRVDPRQQRSLQEYAAIYSEWLLLARGRLQQQAVELPEAYGGERGMNDEIMRCAQVYHLPQVGGQLSGCMPVWLPRGGGVGGGEA